MEKERKAAMGSRLRTLRRRAGLTQLETAQRAGLSDRAYADIERGNVNLRAETILGICAALQVTPNELLLESGPEPLWQKELIHRLKRCAPKERETALRLLSVYLDSLPQEADGSLGEQKG